MSFRVAVVGAGRMGKLHARVLGELGPGALACIVDTNLPAATAVARQRDCPALDDVAAAVELADAAIIAVPTRFHVQAARPFVEAGKPVLIEKPIADQVEPAQELIELARKTGTSVQVGHTERFNPAVLAMSRHAIRPKFIEAQRISPFTFRSADVGVVLDMMIHDLDLILMMVQAEPQTIHAVGVSVIGQHEDIANARLIFDNGCTANVTASRLAIKTERKMRIFSEEAYLSMDYGKKVGVVIQKSQNLDLIDMARKLDVDDLAELAGSVDYTQLLKVENLVVDDSVEPLRRQMEAFRRTVEEGEKPAISGEEGLAAVRTAHKIVESIRQHRWDGAASERSGVDVLRKQ